MMLVWCIPFSSKRTSNFLDKHCSRNTSASDLTSFRTPYTRIVADHHHVDFNTSSARFLHRHAEVQHIASVVHYNHEDALVFLNAMQDTSSHLLCTWRSEDGTCDCSG